MESITHKLLLEYKLTYNWLIFQFYFHLKNTRTKFFFISLLCSDSLDRFSISGKFRAQILSYLFYVFLLWSRNVTYFFFFQINIDISISFSENLMNWKGLFFKWFHRISTIFLIQSSLGNPWKFIKKSRMKNKSTFQSN